MDKEEFNQSELQNIEEFQPFKAEFFGVPEHSRPKMEDYKLPESADSSLPENPIQENEDDGYTKNLMENATGSGSGSAPGSASPGSAGGAGGSGASGGAGTGASAGAGSAGAAGSGAAAGGATTIASVSTGALVLTAVVGGAAIGVVPIEPTTPPEPPIVEPIEPPTPPPPPVVDKEFGTLKPTNYINSFDNIEGELYQILKINFDGSLNPGFSAKITDLDKNKEYTLPIEKFQVQNLYSEKSFNFRYDVTNIEFDEIVYSQDVKVKDLGLDFTSYSNNVGFKTRYVSTTDTYNVYFYYDTTYQDEPDAYPFETMEARIYSKESDRIESYLPKKIVDNGGMKDIYSLEGLPTTEYGIKLVPYIKDGDNLIAYESLDGVNFNDDIGVNITFNAQRIAASCSLETITSDVSINVQFEDGTEENVIAPKQEVIDDNFEQLLTKYSENYVVSYEYESQVPEWDYRNLIDDTLVVGETTRMRHVSRPYNEPLSRTFGDFHVTEVIPTVHPDPYDPSLQVQDVVINFGGSVNAYYYPTLVHPVSNEQIEWMTHSTYKFENLPLDVEFITLNIYTERWTTTKVDDAVIYTIDIPINVPPVTK